MMVIIVGTNHADMIKIRKRDEDKHFLDWRGQLYKVAPDALSKMRIYDAEGREKESEEVLVFAENSIVPYHPRDVDYSMDRTLAEIDEHKLMAASGGFLHRRAGIVMKQAVSAWRQIAPVLPLAVGLIIVGWAMLQ